MYDNVSSAHSDSSKQYTEVELEPLLEIETETDGSPKEKVTKYKMLTADKSKQSMFFKW